nr:envelope glycoprotein H [Equid gammaherpesvirus 5]
MMKYSLLCACVTLVWWAGGSVGIASSSTPATTRRPPPPTRNKNYREMISKNPILKINLGSVNYTLNWTAVAQVIPDTLIQKMWEEANVTETLWWTLNKFVDVWKTENVTKNFTELSTKYVCNVSNNEQKYNFSVHGMASMDGNKIPGYTGNFGIPATVIQKDLFSGLNDVLQPLHATHDVFYTTRDYNAYFYVSMGNKDAQSAKAEMMGYITRDFAYVTCIERSNGTRFITVMLGYTDRLPVLKGHLIYKSDFVRADNAKFSMVVLTTFADYAYFEKLVRPDFKKMFVELTGQSPAAVIQELENKMVKLEVTQQCPVMQLTPDVFEYVLEFAFAHFMVAAGLRDSGGYVHVNCFFDFIHELNLLRYMTRACFYNFYFKGFTSYHLSTVAGAMVYRTPIPTLPSLSHKQRGDVLATLQIADNVAEMTNMVLWAAAEIINGIYTDYTSSFYLPPENRRHLLDIFLLLKDKERQHRVINSTNLMLIYLLSGSMCNSLEITAVASMLSDKKHYSLYQTFSPCLMSLRYDFTRDKLLSESKLVSNVTYVQALDGAVGFFNILKERHVATFSLLPVSQCLKSYAQFILMVIPMFNITYVVATEPIKEGINYEVKDTFIQKTIVISAVMSNCTNFPDKDTFLRTIPIVYNITRSRSECPMCGAAFVSYDERDGLESMMYVTNKKVEHNLFSDKSPFFDTQNMHTHYLMLFNNGTVIEIRGRYRERTAKFIIISLFILTLLFGAFLAFKIFVYCC